MTKSKRSKTGGRKRGTPNRMTRTVREIIQAALDGCADLIPGALRQLAQNDPAKAIDLYTRLAEYVVPKLTRSEVTATVAATKLERPITSAQEASEIYAQIMRGDSIDLDSVRFALPEPASTADLAAPVTVAPVEAVTAPALPDVLTAAVGETPAEHPTVALYRKLGK